MTPDRFITCGTRWIVVALFSFCGALVVNAASAQETTDSWAEPSYLRLADPKIADALKLTDEQRIKVADLITLRTEEIAKTTAADRPEVLARHEKKLAEVLTDEQRALFAKDATPPRLRFNFRFQRWTEVLEWFARQGDLSLVMDAPPPGTFNYSDNRDYTPVEALDLLNGVLSTKGYTLIRRGRMLLVIDIQEGIPEGLIPRVPLEELDKRGKFELVSVMFPLADLDPQVVKTEIAPLLGPFGKSVALTQTKQLLVTDTAGIMRTISAVISSIPKSAATAPSTQPPVLGVYSVNAADAKVAEEVLVKMFPAAKVVADVKAEQVNAFATPDEQAAIKGVIEQMQAHNPPEKKPRLEVYPATNADPTQLVTNLTLVAPTARITFDPRERQIIAFATPNDHGNIKTAMEKLTSGGPVERTRQLEVYRLSKADPSAALTLLQGLLPQAKFSLDPQTRRVVAIASTEDHKSIRAILDQLQSLEPGPDTQTLKFYPLEHPLAATSLKVLAALAPKAQIVDNSETKQLQVLASPIDHTVIKTNLDEIMKGTSAAEKRKLAFYPVTPAQRTQFQSVLPALNTDLADIRVIPAGDPNELAVWAKPSQHTMLNDIIEELKHEAPAGEKYQLISYPLRFADPTIASTVLQTLFPGAKINVDANTSRLLIWTRPADHPAIKQALQELDGENLSERKESVGVYPVPEIDPDVAMGLLQQMLPKIRLMKDSKARSIVAWGKKADHDLISRTLASMKDSADGEQKPRLKIYPAGKFNAVSLAEVLKVTIPSARMSVDTKTGGLAVLGTAAEQEQVQSAINQIANQGLKENSRLVTYTMSKHGTTSAIAILTQAAPDARFSVGQDPSQLLVWARGDEHAVIEKIVEQLESESSPKKKLELRVYSVRSTGVTSAITMLNRVVPKAMLSAGTDAGRIIAWAMPVDHDVIAQIVKQLDADHPSDTTIEFYDIPNVDSEAALRVVQTITQKPGTGATVTLIQGTNQLYVEARPEQHAIVRDALKRLRTTAEAGVEVFQLEKVDPQAADALIRRMFGGSRTAAPVVEADATTQKLYVRGTKEQLTRVRELLEKMGESGLTSSSGSGRVRVIPFAGDPTAAITEIQRVWPQLRSNELRIISSPAAKSNLLLPKQNNGAGENRQRDERRDDDQNDEVLDQDDSKSEAEEAYKSDVSRIPATPSPTNPTGKAAQNGAIALADEPKKTPDPVIVLPRDGTITIISDDAQALDQLDRLLRSLSHPTEIGGRGFAVFALKYAGATSVAETLRQVLRIPANATRGSGPTVVADDRLNAIIVHANRSDRTAIETLIEVLDSSDIPDSLAANRPKRVSVKNGSALQIEQVLRLVYKSQLATGGGRKEIPIPSGLAPEIAAMLQQINATNTGPLLALSVDEVTNSIVIMAPAALGEQVTTLIKELDEAALTENPKGLSIIPTERMNSVRAQKVLNLIFDKSRQRAKRP